MLSILENERRLSSPPIKITGARIAFRPPAKSFSRLVATFEFPTFDVMSSTQQKRYDGENGVPVA